MLFLEVGVYSILTQVCKNQPVLSKLPQMNYPHTLLVEKEGRSMTSLHNLGWSRIFYIKTHFQILYH